MGTKIMIVDDSLFAYEEMKHMLENSEFEIAGYVKSGEEAIERFEEIMPDLVTMDIILPGIDGMEAAGKILERWPETKVVVVSSLAYDETKERAKSIGAKDFIYKPMEKQQLLEALRNAVC